MAQDIFAPKTSFDIGFERPQQGVVDNTEKIRSDFQAMSLGAQAKAVQGQAALERTQASALQSAIGIAGNAYNMYSDAREAGAVDDLLKQIDAVDEMAEQKGMTFEQRRTRYNAAVQDAASQLPGGYRDLAKYNTTLKAKTGMDFSDLSKTTEQEQYEAMQRDPKFMTAYLASKTLNPSYTPEQHAMFAQNKASESAAVELMATTADVNDKAQWYTKLKPVVENRIQNLDTAIIASIQLKRDTGEVITTTDIEALEVRVAEARRIIDLAIPNTISEDERSQYSEYFTNLGNFLTEMKETKDPEKIAEGVASYLAQTGNTMGEVIAGASITKSDILASPAGLELFKNITTKLSDGSDTAAISSKGDLGSIFDSLIEARQDEVVGPNTVMTQEELNAAFSTEGLTPEDLITERATGLGLIKNLSVGDIATEKGKKQLIAGIASVVKSLNNLDLQQTGSKLNELIIDSGLVEKLNALDSYGDTATANQIRTLINSAVTNNLRFSEAKLSSLEAEGRDPSNRIMGLVWDEGTQAYYATNQDYIDHLRGGDSSMRAYVQTNLSDKGLYLPKTSEYAKGDSIQRAYKHREVLAVANRILGQTRVEEPDETMVDVGGSPTPERMEVLNFISAGEGGYESSNRGTSGDNIIGSTNSTVRGGKPLSKMTLAEIKGYQRIKDPNNPNRLFAVGAYQITPDAMDAAMKAAGVNDNTIFSPTVQDRMGLGLILGSKRPKLAAYIKGESDDINTAMLEFAKEFASIPDPNTGRSYYDKTGNKAQHTIAETREALERAREAYASGIISERLVTEGEMTPSQVIDTASQAIEEGVEPTTSPRPQLRPGSMNITQADWWNDEMANTFATRMQAAGLDKTAEDVRYFTSREEADSAERLGVIKTGDIIVIGTEMVKVD